ncbi:hypothetical protein OG21DRAFT_437731 [Imleria badia]|nr:hypothetical protein OG21DRAFT_437731 [Imleria badia]
MRVSFLLDIELRTEARRKLPVARQYYVQFSVGDTTRATKSAKEVKNQNGTSWNEILYFDGDDRSVFVVKVYQKHRFEKDALIGSLSETIGGVLRKLKAGVLEDALRKDTSDTSDLSGTTIKFAFATEPRGDVNADERQAIDAVTRATEVVGPLDSTPAVVGLANSAVDAVTNDVTKFQTFESTWAVLMQRMELFNKIVGSIAEIFRAQTPDSLTV